MMLCVTYSLDVKWTPTNEEDSSIPLSSNYRDSLRKLCELLKSGESLPKNIIDQKAELELKCQKLFLDDESSEYISDRKFPSGLNRNVVGGLIALFAGFGFYQYRNVLSAKLKRMATPTSSSSSHSSNDLREARLKKFS